ncbi:MAG: hypothetical protein MN733_37680, partial [Nitrososphaera sp.]|nr:hypothetical protein [Nitrososphaera sp.]
YPIAPAQRLQPGLVRLFYLVSRTNSTIAPHIYCVLTRSPPLIGIPTVLVGTFVTSVVGICAGSDAQAARTRINPS